MATECKQWDTFQDMVRERGGSVRTVDHISPHWRLVIVYRGEGTTAIPCVVRLMGEDGYGLYVRAEGIKIDEDVAALWALT